MRDLLKRSWAVVDLDCLAHNIASIRRALRPGCLLMGVVKADAYGHGDRFVAEELLRLGADWFGVSNIDEAAALRRCGIRLPILIFGYTPPQYAKELAEQAITQAVYAKDYAEALSAAAVEAGVALDIHIKIDTGMSRIGFQTDAGFLDGSVEEILAACALPGLRAGGIFTHFACSDELAKSAVGYTEMQFSRFQSVTEALAARGQRFALRHCANSGAIVNHPSMQLDMVRAGIITYGLRPSGDCADFDLRPILSLYSTVAQVKEVPAGTALSYGRTFVAERPMRIATLPIGYADGYPRALSSRGRVLLRGRSAPVVGRVCMDQILVDVTAIPDAAPGDLVTLVGADGEETVTLDEMAALCDTINYELACRISRRVPRIYRRDGRDVAVADYIGGRVEGLD